MGRKPILLTCSIAILLLSGVYAMTTRLWVILLSAIVHGVFWSALLSASAALMADLIPSARRAEGIGYWGMASALSIALAPSLGLWILEYGWDWLCLLIGTLAMGMFLIAFQFPEKSNRGRFSFEGFLEAALIEKRVFLLSMTLFLYTFGYGGITSFVALYAQDHGIRPKGLFFTVFSIVILATRPFLGRLADRKGRRRVLLPCLALIAISVGLLALSPGLPVMITSAVLFGVGFGSAYPVFAAYILERVDVKRRGVTFGSILLALDTGIGSGSILLGVVIEHFGYRPAFALGSLLALGSIPYFRFVDNRFGRIPTSMNNAS